MNTYYANIIIRNRAGDQTSFMSSSGGVWPVLSAKFSLHKNGGCGAFEMVCKRDTIPGTISSNDLIEFWADSKSSSGLARYYMGIITTVPSAGTTAREVRYTANGIWLQAQSQTIIKDYESADIDDMVIDILDDIDNDSDISTSTTEISIASPHTLGDFEPEFMPAAKAIALLAGVQNDVQYGIDQNGKLYFKDVITTVQKKFWVGKTVERFEPEDLSDDMINRVYLQSKTIVGGGSLTLARSDATSITNNGLRDAVVRVPHLAVHADVWAYGQHVLDTNAIKTVADTKLAGFSEFIFPRGNAQIITTAAVGYSLPIDSVTYTLDETEGLRGELGVGDEAVSEWGVEIQKLIRELETNKSNAISLTKIEHTRGEEWARDAVIDAKVNGNLNTFFDTFKDIKAINQDESFHIYHDNSREYLGQNLPGEQPTIVSNIIPTGEIIDSVRVHLDQDWLGRTNFVNPVDRTDFYNPDGGTWGVKVGTSMMRQATTGGRNRLRYNTSFSFPAAYKINTAWYYQTTSQTGESGIAFNINPAVRDTYYYATLANEAANMVLRLYTVVLGAATQRGGDQNLIKDQNYLLEVEMAGSTITATATNIGGTTSTNNVAYASATPVAAYEVAIQQLMQAAAEDFYVDYFEIENAAASPEVGEITIYVSRTGGANWQSISNLSSTTNMTFDVSGQPNGTELRLKAEIDHPARLYGWGISFSN